MSTPLDVEVRAALEAKRGFWKQVAADTGVSYSWISQFVRNKIPNPGYATLVRLRDELAKPTAEAA
jgi:transcriptional regulator with XRE-family HTH domain